MTIITDATRWTAVPNDDHALYVIDVFADGPGRCHVAGVIGVQDYGEPCGATWGHAQLIAAAPLLLCLLQQARAPSAAYSNSFAAGTLSGSALPDAWCAVRCDLPHELVEAIDAAIRMATAPAPEALQLPVPTPPDAS